MSNTNTSPLFEIARLLVRLDTFPIIVEHRARELLGNHRRQSQQNRLELGCASAVDSCGRTIFVGDAMAVEAGGTGKNEK
jgi:hypothetical protein